MTEKHGSVGFVQEIFIIHNLLHAISSLLTFGITCVEQPER